MTDNELIAEFMGGWNADGQTINIGTNLPFMKDHWFDYTNMKFQTSWDWLMPVVQRIKNFDISHFDYDVSNMTQFRLMYEHFIGLRITAPIELVYVRAVEIIKFINGHNSNKP